MSCECPLHNILCPGVLSRNFQFTFLGSESGIGVVYTSFGFHLVMNFWTRECHVLAVGILATLLASLEDDRSSSELITPTSVKIQH